MAVMSLLLTLFLFLLQPLPFSYVFASIRGSSGLNLFLNWLPLFLLMLFLYFCGAGAVTACTVTGAVGIALGFANRTKIILRGDPLVPWDLLLGGEVVGIAHSFGIAAILMVVGGALFYILAAVVAACLIRSEGFNWKWRVVGALACVVFALLINRPLYNNWQLNANLHVEGNIWNQVNQFNSRGFVYSFIHAFNTNRVMRPEGYDPDAVLHWIRKSNTSGAERLAGQELPHIIMIMAEAFSDISDSPHFDFTDFTDPLENWHELIAEGISGDLVVSVLGGGTAQTEFDVLTGLNARQFAGVPFAFRMITDEFESFASIVNSLGFRSEFMHPGFDWFYNRRNVYRFMGFERLVFIDEFDDIPTKGMYINEHDTINRIMEMFAEHRKNFPGMPYFNFTVTIQNHGPYVDKFLYDGPVTEANFDTDLEFAEIDINALSNYFHGIIDADVELRRLADYLQALDEPVVLVYFSDHKPALPARLYDTFIPTFEPGSFEDLTRLFNVPFLIWMNDAALELYGVSHPSELKPNPDEEMLFSSPFFGAFVMEVLGMTNLSPFWDLNMDLRQMFPIMTEMRSFTPCRMISTYMTDYPYQYRRNSLLLYRDWSYFRIFDERR